MHNLIKIVGSISLSGNRSSPLVSGYRPLFLIEGEYVSGMITFEENEGAVLTLPLVVTVGFIKKEPVISALRVLRRGDEIRFYENPNFLAGTLQIIKVDSSS